MQECQAQAVLALLTKLHKSDLLDKYSAEPTDRVCLPCIEVCLPGTPLPLSSVLSLTTLAPPGAAIASSEASIVGR